MASYKDLWRLLRNGTHPAEIVDRLNLPHSKMLRLLSSKRLRHLSDAEMAVMFTQAQVGRIGQNR